MSPTIRMVGHEDRLSVVEHLEELRRRLIICLAALALAFALCLWQSHILLGIVNHPFGSQTRSQVQKGDGVLGQATLAQRAVLQLAGENERIAGLLSGRSSGLPAGVRAQLAAEVPRLRADVSRIPRVAASEKPAALGVGEPFTATVTVALYFAFLLVLPLILFELYGFLLPALTPQERAAVTPLLWSVPVLFVCGALFGYFLVVPAAVHFLLNFNSGEFNVLVQANPYYDFVITTLIAVGLSFELPVAILGATRAGLVSARGLRRGRRYAFLGCVVIAALLPGEVVTMVLETVPLYLLYEASILLAALGERRRHRAAAMEAAEAGNLA